MATTVQSITGPIQGAKNTALPRMVAGESFKSMADFEKAISRNGIAVLPPGKSVSIKVGTFGVGGGAPRIANLNKNSSFVTKYKDGNLIITAKPKAKIGTTDNVVLDHAGPVVMNPPPSKKFPFQLQVGIGHIIAG